jgi:signal transduction histidine kinase
VSAVLLLFLGAVITYFTVVGLLDAEHLVNHTRDVQSALSNIGTLNARLGRSRIEYLGSGDSAPLNDYQAAVEDMGRAVALIEHLTADNKVQQNYCIRLETLVNERIRLTGQSIEMKERGKSNRENEGALTEEIVRVGAEMEALLRKMRSLEEQLLSARQARSLTLFRRAILLFSAAFVLALLLLALHYFLLNQELRARQRAEESLRRLNARLLEIQDEERRKISQELHESLGQYLSGVKMNLEIASKSLPQNSLLAECVTILDKSISETRTMSHLLHPPLLDEIGFGSAAKWYVEGFSERTGIKVDLTLPADLPRLAGAIELTLFRMLQESLTNIQEHSGSKNAVVTVRFAGLQIELQVGDKGKGISSSVLERFESNNGYLGVGLTGMRERLRELGGRMQVQSDARGTVVVASLPIPPAGLKAKDDAKRHARTR